MTQTLLVMGRNEYRMPQCTNAGGDLAGAHPYLTSTHFFSNVCNVWGNVRKTNCGYDPFAFTASFHTRTVRHNPVFGPGWPSQSSGTWHSRKKKKNLKLGFFSLL